MVLAAACAAKQTEESAGAAFTDAGATNGAADARLPTGDAARATNVGNHCPRLPASRVTECPTDPQKAYLAITETDGVTRFACAFRFFADKNRWEFNKPQNNWVPSGDECCGTMGTAQAFAPAPLTAAGYLGSPHSADHIKAQELTLGKAGGDLRHNPFSLVIKDPASGQAFNEMVPVWRQWYASGMPQMAPDGSGPYYVTNTINYVIVQDSQDNLIIIAGPEVSLTGFVTDLWGHPTLSPCATAGTATALIGGVIDVTTTTLNNDSGRFGTDPSVTFEALSNAAKLFNERGVTITKTKFVQ